MRSGILNDGTLSPSSFSCPQNCSCSGSSILKCNFYDPPAALASISTTSSSLLDPDDLYLDDNRSGEQQQSSNSKMNDLDELNKLASKHLDPNSSKISVLMCQKGKCFPIEDLDSFLHSCARVLYIRKNRSKRKFH